MAKRYQDLYILWCDQERAMSAKAIAEIREMLLAMGVKPGERYEIVSRELTTGSNIVAVDVPGAGENAHLWCVYKTGDPPPIDYNYCELFRNAHALTEIHYRIRKDYNRFVRTHKNTN